MSTKQCNTPQTMANYSKTYSEDGILIFNHTHSFMLQRKTHGYGRSVDRDEVRQFTLGHLKEEKSPGEETWEKQEKEALQS